MLALPVFALEMGGHLTGLHMLLGQTLSNWIQFALATPVVLWAGWPFFVRGWQSLVTRNLNMFTLIAMGTGVAYGLQRRRDACARTCSRRRSAITDGAVAVYFEAAAVITVLVLLGQVLELRAREQTSGAIRALLDLAPKTARRVTERRQRRGGPARYRRSSATACACGPARRSRSTATVIEGRSSLDESMVTGESMPVTKEPAPRSIGGTLNPTGSFVMRAEKVGRDTLLAQIVQMVAAGAAQPRADPAAGRPGRRLVRAGGDRRRAARLRRLGDVRAGAALRLSAWSRRSAC